MAMVTRVVFLVILAATPVWTQVAANKGIIVGTVLGPDGAAIRDTKVTVLNGGTGLLRAGLTNEAGQYWFGALDPGTYELTVEASGFARATVKEVVVNVGAAVQVNLTLAAEAFINHVDLSVPSSSVVNPTPAR